VFDGGLSFPKKWPKVSKKELSKFKNMNYQQIAFHISKKFIENEINDKDLKKIIKKSFKNFEINDSLEVNIGTGVMLGHMVRELTKKSVKGLESLVGVPGTLGGALIMNAGAYGSEISNYLISIKVLDLDGNEKIYKKEDINFSYRFASIAKTDIVIEAQFKFKKGNLSNIIKNRSSASQKRRNNQPLQFRSAGSIFKNPKSDMAAGYLIDKSNLKGTRIGDAEISTKHANFIINHGKASSNDILKLIKIIKNTVKQNFNINLELEVNLLGFNDNELEGVA
jgi:UDP-N-acetylmuramate dehydrogenase